MCYVTFYAEDGSKNKVSVLFRSDNTAQAFIDTYQYVGGINQFAYDMWGDAKCFPDIDFRKMPTVANKPKTFMMIYRQLYSR